MAESAVGARRTRPAGDVPGRRWDCRATKGKQAGMRGAPARPSHVPLSVQASSAHFCTPRNDTGPYIAVEVGYPNEQERLLQPYADAISIMGKDSSPILFVNVPAAIIQAVVSKHQELSTNSVNLPPMIIQDSEETDSSSDSEYARNMGSPTSAVHLGVIPPPPPPSISLAETTITTDTDEDMQDTDEDPDKKKQRFSRTLQ